LVSLSFDKVNKIITVLAPDTEITMQELVNLIRDWEDELENLDTPKVVDAAGKQDLGGGVLVGITVTLLDWKLKFEDRAGPNYTICNVTGGNLVTYDSSSGTYVNPIEPAAYVTVTLTASSSATLQELTAIQHSSFNDRVIIDVVNGVSGTAFPTGTGEQPVNNLSDAQTIAAERGITTLYIRGDITIGATDNIDNYKIIGQGHGFTTITFINGCSASNTEFWNADLQGTLDGGDQLVNFCNIEDLINFSGIMYDCSLHGTIVLDGTDDVMFINCHSGITGSNIPIIDMGGSGRGMAVRAYSGGLKIINKSGSETASLDFVSGQLKIDSTVTGGTIVVRGNVKITENNGSATIEDYGAVYGDLLKQLREGNVSYEFVSATSDNTTRNVASGYLDHMIIKIKNDSDSDWSSPVRTQTLYYWYETLGDSNPIYVKESE